MKHFILMWGLKGCLPVFCEAYTNKEDAIFAAYDILELPKYGQIIKNLRKFNYVDFNEAGIEYIEIQICNCQDISIHCGD